MGKLICMEAGDGSGKETQSVKLYQRLKSDHHRVMEVEFPDYASDSSALIKMYLGGDFGSRPEDVSPYVASTFYAVDRYASYKKKWEPFYQEGGIVLADRYTTSNMIHQASKIDGGPERERFLEWLWDFEFRMFGLPEPDCVLLLDMPVKYAARLMKNRKNKFNGSMEKDIHEKDCAYLERSYRTSLRLAEKYGWHRIACVKDGAVRSVGEIHKEIYGIVRKYL